MTAKPPSISRALASALKATPPEPKAAALVALAKRLASDLDAALIPDDVAKLSARLLPTLVELGMGRTAAGAVTKGGAPGGPVDALARLRAERATR